MKVLKFGGTSVGSAENFGKVCRILLVRWQQGEKMAVVVSAMGGVTNLLIEAGQKAAVNDEQYKVMFRQLEEKHYDVARLLIQVRQQSRVMAQLKIVFNEMEDLLHGIYLLKELSPRTLDLLQSFGERLSAYLLSEYLRQEGMPATMLDARQVIRTDSSFNSAKVNFPETNSQIANWFGMHPEALPIITGFIASTAKGETTTLGRGGSDYTAAIVGAALHAAEIEIWTDVDGVMTADPRVVRNAFPLSRLSYIEAMEMSHFGAKVIYPPTLQPAFSQHIPLRIKNTFRPEFEGTLITETTGHEDLPIKGISSIREVALLTLSGSGMVGVPGVSSRLFGALARHRISVILITQASSEHSITFALAPAEAEEARRLIEEEFAGEMAQGKIDPVSVEKDLSVIAMIGENMRNTPGIAGTMFTALGKNGINVAAIAQGSSELNLSAVIPQRDLSKALNALHEAFFLSDQKTLNLYLLGVGLIGGTLIGQIRRQAEYLLAQYSLKINVVGMANTRKMVFDEAGLDLSLPKEELLANGKPSDLEEFIRQIHRFNLPNSVLVDCTSSQQVIPFYERILDSSISIVTPNKLANSGAWQDYLRLQQAARRRRVRFLYETNVGAGLPVIGPLNDLKISGDRIIRIDGVLSGTLSFIFNTFRPGTRFSEVVRQAQEKGYTEPDPRDDLSCMDVARKILILAREAGYALELADIRIEPVLPASCLQAANIPDFYRTLEAEDAYFEGMLQKAEAEQKVLRCIASLEDGQATIRLQAVDAQHPFYQLSGSDNVVAFTTDRYLERPLVIKGPGAGAEVTAAGVFAEIISIRNYLSR